MKILKVLFNFPKKFGQVVGGVGGDGMELFVLMVFVVHCGP